MCTTLVRAAAGCLCEAVVSSLMPVVLMNVFLILAGSKNDHLPVQRGVVTGRREEGIERDGKRDRWREERGMEKEREKERQGGLWFRGV